MSCWTKVFIKACLENFAKISPFAGVCPLIFKWRAEMSISAPRKSVKWHEWELWRINSTSIVCSLPSNPGLPGFFPACGSPYEHVPINLCLVFPCRSDPSKCRCHLLCPWYRDGGGIWPSSVLVCQGFTVPSFYCEHVQVVFVWGFRWRPLVQN